LQWLVRGRAASPWANVTFLTNRTGYIHSLPSRDDLVTAAVQGRHHIKETTMTRKAITTAIFTTLLVAGSGASHAIDRGPAGERSPGAEARAAGGRDSRDFSPRGPANAGKPTYESERSAAQGTKPERDAGIPKSGERNAGHNNSGPEHGHDHQAGTPTEADRTRGMNPDAPKH